MYDLVMVGGVAYEQISEWVADLYRATDGPGALTGKVRTAARLRGWLDVVQAELTTAGRDAGSGRGPRGDGADSGDDGAAEGGGGSGSGGGSDPRGMRGQSKMSAAEAARVARRAEVLAQAPAWRAALAAGEVGAAHVDAFARALARTTPAVRVRLLVEVDLVAEAAGMSPERFERHLEGLVRGWQAESDTATQFDRQRKASNLRLWKDHETGMWNGRFSLDPEWGKKVFDALRRETDLLWSEQPADRETPADVVLAHLGAKALVNLLEGGSTANGNGCEVMLHIDWRTLSDGLHLDSLCELSDGTPIPVSTARRLCCDAVILPVVIGTGGELLELAHEVRLANRAQRRALRAMYRTCVAPDCHVDFDRCHIHHVVWWERFGPTDLANLVPVCWRHHYMLHEGGWTLAIGANRDLTFTSPFGDVFHEPLAHSARWRPAGHRQQGDRPAARGAPPGTTGPPGSGPPAGSTDPPDTTEPSGDAVPDTTPRLFDVVA